MIDLSTPIENLYLIGPVRARLFKKLGIHTLENLLFYFPRTHQDLSRITPIETLKADEFANIKARVLEIKSFRTKIRRLSLTQALVEDDTGSILCTWFNQPFLTKVIKAHETFLFSGKVVKEKNKLQMQNPIYEQEKSEQVHTARLVPVYPLTAQITQKQLRMIIKTYLDKIDLREYLPDSLIKAERLLDENTAVKMFHFPPDFEMLHKAQNRLAFDEIFQTQVKVLKEKNSRQKEHAVSIPNTQILEDKIKTLPFELTASQSQTIKEIAADLTRDFPANRLLEGDVGSGKTIVAALSMWLAAKNGMQSVLLAPTEILASQHYHNLLDFFEPDLKTILFTSSLQKINSRTASRQEVNQNIAAGLGKVIFGTHALLEKTVSFNNLALVVIDEQHRFGVQQRAALKNLHHAHLLTMSATPIPRTLALTLYGDLDISLLSELPAGRKKIETKLVSETDRGQTYEFIAHEIERGRQAFVICPLIEPSDKLGVKSVIAEAEKLKDIFKQLRIGLLHGKLKAQEKEEIMRQFKDNEIQILAATSVIEVGVDVPNATVMIIEGAERFGLAQLHQFRGRVGRSHHQSHCFIFSDDPESQTNPRLNALVESTNGFELAEKDLQIRGGGDLYGTAQSGYNFKIATLSNLDLVQKSRQYAQELLTKDPDLSSHPLLKQKIDKQSTIHLE